MYIFFSLYYLLVITITTHSYLFYMCVPIINVAIIVQKDVVKLLRVNNSTLSYYLPMRKMNFINSNIIKFIHISSKTIVRVVICLMVIMNIYFFIHNTKVLKQIYELKVIKGNQFNQTKLIWPEQLPFGDRIRTQMNYIPKTYDYEKSPIIRILLFNGLGSSWEVPKLDQGEFYGCPVSQCTLTIDLSLGSEVEAVLFRHTYFTPEWKRPSHQIWIIHQMESPYVTQFMPDENVFNMTATYRWDSDIPSPYGYFMEYNPPLPRIEKNYAVGKNKKVAWFVSNCKAMSNRLTYAKELAKHISVDIYGYCGNLSCSRSNDKQCYKMLETDYKFYLAFENARCLYYITEKFFENSLCHNVLPIVMGPSREHYELMAPKHSFIHVDDFNSPKLLAKYLHEVDKNDTLYNEYFKWKGTGTVNNGQQAAFYCRLCAMLHASKERPPKHYEDINKWWNDPEVCWFNSTTW